MAEILTANPRFTTRHLLTLRSPWAFIHRMVDIALRFAALGKADEAVELLEMADAYVPIPARSVYDLGLYFAFQAADWWPDFTPDEDMEDEHLLRGLEVNTVVSNFGRMVLDRERGGERDRRDLERVLAWVVGNEVLRERKGEWGGSSVFVLVENDKEGDVEIQRERDARPLTMFFDSAVFFGVHLAIKLEDKEATERLFEVVGRDLEHFLPRLARYRFVWRVLVTGILGPKTEEEKKEVQEEFERLKAVIKRRIKNGVEFPFLDEPTKDLVKMLDENTRQHVHFEEFLPITDELDEEGPYSPPQRQPLSSIRRPGLSSKALDDLEERLDVTLPDDYKEFLRVSDGMDWIWTGYHRQRLLALSSSIAWKKPPAPQYFEDGEPMPLPPPRVLSLIPYSELPENFGIVWPILKPEGCLVISGNGGELNPMEGGVGGVLCLVRGWLLRKARNRLTKRIEALAEGEFKEKKWVEKVVGDYFGGIEELGELGEGEKGENGEWEGEGWGVVYWDRSGMPTQVWGSFREWMENAVVKSEFPNVVLEKKDLRS